MSIPANSEARILSSRSLYRAASLTTADARAAALLALAEVEIAEAKALVKGMPPSPGRHRRRIDAEVRSILSAPDPRRRI